MATLLWITAEDLFRVASNASVECWQQDKAGADKDLDFTRREADAWLVLATCLKAMQSSNLPKREREDYVYWMDCAERMFAFLETIHPLEEDSSRRRTNIKAVQEAIALYKRII